MSFVINVICNKCHLERSELLQMSFENSHLGKAIQKMLFRKKAFGKNLFLSHFEKCCYERSDCFVTNVIEKMAVVKKSLGKQSFDKKSFVANIISKKIILNILTKVTLAIAILNQAF